MSAISALPSTLRVISEHAILQYMDRVDKTISFPRARTAVFLVYHRGHDATAYELAAMHRSNDEGEVVYRIWDSCFGLVVMPIRRGVMVTLWLREHRQ